MTHLDLLPGIASIPARSYHLPGLGGSGSLGGSEGLEGSGSGVWVWEGLGLSRRIKGAGVWMSERVRGWEYLDVWEGLEGSERVWKSLRVWG